MHGGRGDVLDDVLQVDVHVPGAGPGGVDVHAEGDPVDADRGAGRGHRAQEPPYDGGACLRDVASGGDLELVGEGLADVPCPGFAGSTFELDDEPAVVVGHALEPVEQHGLPHAAQAGEDYGPRWRGR